VVGQRVEDVDRRKREYVEDDIHGTRTAIVTPN
jgi:hypothetical protein